MKRKPSEESKWLFWKINDIVRIHPTMPREIAVEEALAELDRRYATMPRHKALERR